MSYILRPRLAFLLPIPLSMTNLSYPRHAGVMDRWRLLLLALAMAAVSTSAGAQGIPWNSNSANPEGLAEATAERTAGLSASAGNVQDLDRWCSS